MNKQNKQKQTFKGEAGMEIGEKMNGKKRCKIPIIN